MRPADAVTLVPGECDASRQTSVELLPCSGPYLDLICDRICRAGGFALPDELALPAVTP